MEIKGYRDLRVWQAGMELAEEAYKITTNFPDRELYGLTNSIRRAAVNIPSNIAQGHTLETTKDYLYHLNRAQAHLADLQTQLELAGRFRYLTAEQLDQTMDRTISLAKQLYSLRNALLRHA